MKIKFLCLVVALILPTLLLAQVNTESMRTFKKDDGFSGFVDSGNEIIRGNVEYTRFNLGARLQYQRGTISHGKYSETRDLLFATSDNKIGKKNADEYLNKNFHNARWTHMWHHRIGNEIFTQYEYNAFSKLRIRKIVGVGFRFSLYKNDAISTYLGSAYLNEYEKYDKAISDSRLIDRADKNHRLSNYLTIKFGQKENRLKFNTTIYMQPRINEFADYQVLGDFTLEYVISKNFSFIMAANMRYDRRPILNTKKKNTGLSNKLRFRF